MFEDILKMENEPVFSPGNEYGDYVISDKDLPHELGLDIIREAAFQFVPEEYRTDKLVIGCRPWTVYPEDGEPMEVIALYWKYSPLPSKVRLNKKDLLTDK